MEALEGGLGPGFQRWLAAEWRPRPDDSSQTYAWGALYEVAEGCFVPHMRTPRDPIENAQGRMHGLADTAAARDGEERPREPGRPRIGDATVALAAYLVDVEQKSLGELPIPFRKSVATIRRYRDRGRRVLCDDGAWPWVIAEDGDLPDEWWRDSLFVSVLVEWAFGMLPLRR